MRTEGSQVHQRVHYSALVRHIESLSIGGFEHGPRTRPDESFHKASLLRTTELCRLKLHLCVYSRVSKCCSDQAYDCMPL